MADWLLLRLPRTPDEPATWLIASAAGVPLAATQSGALADAAPAATGRRVCAIVAGSDVLLAEPELPAKSGIKLQQLVPYALEEQLADNIDELHFALGRRAADSKRTPVAVVARTLMDEWLAALRAAGLEPECVYADSELLPANPGQAVALLEEDSVCVRAPGAPPVSLPVDALAEALAVAESSAPAAEAAGLILYSGSAAWQRHAVEIEDARGRFASLKVQLLGDGPLALFAQQLPSTAAINLLQGGYAPKRSPAAGLAAWRVAAVLLLALVALHVAGKAAELRVLQSKEHEVDASIRDTFHRALPAEAGTADARRRMEQRLAAVRNGGGSSGLLSALQAVAQARGNAAGTGVQSLNFHDGLLELTLSAPDAASLDHLSQQLRNGGWQADLVGGNTVGGAYQGRVQIRAH
ncbi:MAG TPA: type II secretion system protein GspL [Steroidobacteraceae bacterium]|nr:type II secretion system protein GspL [Steroidobacteraceae bacterium]